MEEDNNQLKISCQCCNGFVTYSGSSVILLYITFIRSGFSTLGLYPEELDPENVYSHCPSRKKSMFVSEYFERS